MHMVSRKDLDSPELETVRVSKNPTTVMTANGEVLTKEEATLYVRELNLFVTVMLLEDTPALPSLGKLCEDHGFYCHWTSGRKPQWQEDRLQHSERCTLRCPSSSSSLASSTSSSQDAVTTTEHPATEISESMSEESRGIPSHGSAETENPKK